MVETYVRIGSGGSAIREAGLLPRDVVREQVQLFAKHVILRYA
jgi:hypothetical protein